MTDNWSVSSLDFASLYEKFFADHPCTIETPILNYYFKKVVIADFYTWDAINRARRKMGYIK